MDKTLIRCTKKEDFNIKALDKNPQTGILDKKWRKNQDGLKRK